ncbi:MAG: hypothetical protein VX672_10410 [Planctomycetota bacterium]|nr:hypothetical protein [Planctomycetota bacterium]
MTPQPPPLLLSRREVVDRYFLEHRAKILDLAAFLDRVDRARNEGGVEGEDAGEDFRMRSFRAAIALLLDGEPERTRRILDLLSDPSTEPIPTAPMKGATGAWEGFEDDAEGSVG